ncbi:MAG: NADH-ubiquinone oxidoreductase-F iron-sulfur binding region domain-containing protein [Clostridiaceae bacterium]|nr:NADH-ubiquinone oxidoreductase-F iron-sulfur binding region domain-containing protein [Clostridiaceae bacterium]
MNVMPTLIRSAADLDSIRAAFSEQQSHALWTLSVCAGAGCISCDCLRVRDALLDGLRQSSLSGSVVVKMTGCMGNCDIGPVMLVQPGDVLYCRLKPEHMAIIIRQHLMQEQIVESLCPVDPRSGQPVLKLQDMTFFNKQQKIVLKNCGIIDYGSLEDWITHDGMRALHRALTTMTPEQVIDEIRKSGLRGRGGGGFPTGLKWSLARRAPEGQKYVICNADEGDPGAFMDRSLLEGDPFTVIEGMTIGGYAIGASQGFVYVRAEYPLAVERLSKAIEEARRRGLLGQNIFNSGFSFDLQIRIGAGAFVCGEETALMNSVEGRRGEPRQKPPFPSDSGLFGRPTVINNVETFGNVPSILRQGSAWFASIGTEKSKGTKVFALAGDIRNTGIVEVPMGMTLGEILYDIGGGVPRGKKFKVAQTGGPSGGCLTRAHLGAPVDYESLVELGAIMGSGGLICMDEDTCMVDVARFFMDFVQDESCGKCVACRIGTRRMLEILERITRGEGVEGDVERLVEIGETVKDTALCGLGQTAPNPVLSTIKYFRDEYDEHIRHHYCRAGVCSDLFLSPCENACPAGVNVPGYIALIAAGRPLDAYNLIRQENPFPAVCGRVCTHPCESRCRRAQLDEPLAIADLKRYAADEAMKSGKPVTDVLFPPKNKSVAIIGAGPSGLTCAYYLGRLGYTVDVYEAQAVAGGMLACGIPEYRLPGAVLEHEIEAICQVGIRIHTQTEIGRDLSFADLRATHDAVYIATGTQHSRKINIDGEDLPGVYHGLDFLRDINLDRDIQVHGSVAVIGGGSTAMDAARVALRKGADEVHILYRRGLEDMPADRREIQEALEEGIQIHELLEPVRMTGQNSVEQIVCQKMKLQGFDRDGRRKPVKIPGELVTFAVDLVIPAVSQYSDLPFVRPDEVEMTAWGTFVVDAETQKTTLEGVFAGGDVVRGADVVITAIADGKKAARSIDRYLGGDGVLNKGKPIAIPEPVDDPELAEHERFAMKCLSPQARSRSFDEVFTGFHRLNAIAEAMRCLRCDRR